MNDEYLRPVAISNIARCEACGDLFLKTSIDGRHIRCFGLCVGCWDYFDGFAKFLEEFQPGCDCDEWEDDE